ncbi:FtsZ family, C-terminal domain-containing protein, partial [Dunaliella salina]
MQAAISAISSPLLDIGIEKATGVVWNITGPADMTLFEVNEAAETIYELVDPNANLIFGAVVDPALGDAVMITIMATGFGAVEHSIGALRNERTVSRASPAVPATPLPSSMGRAPPEPVMGGGGGIEIPAFLRRRRLQGK